MKTKKKNKYKAIKPAGISDADLDEIRNMADTLCQAQGMEIVFVEYKREAAGRILRVYIDKPGGVGINDCTAISRELGDLLDVYLENDTAYSLEVSSPGPERPLWKLADFEKFAGCCARIKTGKPPGQVKKFFGKLMGVAESRIKIEASTGDIIEIPHKEISQARLVNHNGESKC